MGSVKRKSIGDSNEELEPPQKQLREDGNEPVTLLHDVSYPEGYVHAHHQTTIEDSKPAKEFPFTLDPFQTEAIKCLNNGESVMVSAHTSAGKTVVALYAIAMSLQRNQRVIYTSPIKALSNQKYVEFKKEFSDVGLMTGDVTIDPNVSCLVMTTEIWRNMQCKGSDGSSWREKRALWDMKPFKGSQTNTLPTSQSGKKEVVRRTNSDESA